MFRNQSQKDEGVEMKVGYSTSPMTSCADPWSVCLCLSLGTGCGDKVHEVFFLFPPGKLTVRVGVCVRGREEGLHREVRDLEQRCQAAEARHQDLAANIPEATRPLLRQLEAMQVTPAPITTPPLLALHPELQMGWSCPEHHGFLQRAEAPLCYTYNVIAYIVAYMV